MPLAEHGGASPARPRRARLWLAAGRSRPGAECRGWESCRSPRKATQSRRAHARGRRRGPAAPVAVPDGPRRPTLTGGHGPDCSAHALVSLTVKAIRRFTIHPALPAALAPLADPDAQPALVLARADAGRCSPRSTRRPGRSSRHDPAGLLARVSPERLAALAADEDFLRRLGEAVDELDEYLTGSRAGTSCRVRRPTARPAIAYFSPEYGITAALPQYSGGLGILAGDHLKSASDLGVPLIGVGLLYRHGYFTQSLSAEGWQAERYPASDPPGLPIALLRDAGGGPAKVTVGLPGGAELRRADLGRRRRPGPAAAARLLHRGQRPAAAGGHRPAVRRRQRPPAAPGAAARHRRRPRGPAVLRDHRHPQPEVFHTNEGHAGFLGVERIREYLAQGRSVRRGGRADQGGHGLHHAHAGAGRHRPVRPGADRGAVRPGRRRAGLPIDQLLAFGAETYAGGDAGVFNMAVMGMRLAQRVNGVSTAARRGQPGDVHRAVAGLRHLRGADRLDHQRRARAELGRTARS